MLSLELAEFMVELKEGSVKNVGPTNKSATAKLFDVDSVEAREFGDRRLKLVATDGEGNELQIALDPEQGTAVREDIEALEAESRVYD
ncbi:MAG: hypothetical protein ABEJ06_01470 [Haloarculaceae archaeon]